MIPVLSLKEFDGTSKSAFVEKLGTTYQQIGFVAIRDHGFPAELAAELHAAIAKFFTLPDEVKLRYHRADLFGQRGYTGYGKEHAKNSTEGDLKEFWQQGPELSSEERSALGYPANLRVEEVPALFECSQRAHEQLLRIGREMLSAIALFLGLEPSYFDPFILKGNSILRPIHYPPISGSVGGAVRSAEHEDINLITLLMGASSAGLQVKDRKGDWIEVAAAHDELVVNVGDMLQRLTSNKLRSTTHRVVNTAEAYEGVSRFSIPFFLHPVSAMPLNGLKECLEEGQKPAYPDITAGDYLDQRLVEIGLKPGRS